MHIGFFFSSRRRHTRLQGDWSSDVCSSDLGRWGSWVRRRGNGKWMLDLWAANEEQLREAGMRGDRIANPRLCTGCRADLFYSYRRGDNGRLVTIAAVPL